MKAWLVETHGGPEALKRVERAVPEPGPLGVRVRVEAVGLNHLDLWVRNGVPGHRFPLPLIPGSDVAGHIDAFGPGAEAVLLKSGLTKNSPILVNPGVSCGRCPACLQGFDPLCPHYGILGEHRDGGCADFVSVPIANILDRGTLSAAEAASLPIPFLTAWTMLVQKAKLQPGELVLIHAGGSGVSVAAIQIAKMVGATVITTVGREDKAEKARALGADHVINYKTSSFRDELKKILPTYGKKGVEVVVDHVGADTFRESIKSLNWGGRLVTCGATSGGDVQIDLKLIFFKNISIIGSTMGSKADLHRIVALVQAKKLSPVIDSSYSMTDLPLALKRLSERDVFGKIVLTQT